MSLYNAKTEGESLRITKFDNDMNVESSYTTTMFTCDCPAGSRPTCRHRQMYYKLQAIADKEYFFDFEEQLYKNANGDHVTNIRDGNTYHDQP